MTAAKVQIFKLYMILHKSCKLEQLQPNDSVSA